MKGIYVVFLYLSEEKTVKVGARGEIEFQNGYYAYVGSAMNGVSSRIRRHFSSTKNKHWHIDYFSSVSEPIDYFILPEKKEWECKISRTLNEIGEPQEGLGASDCDCVSHLYRISDFES